VRAAVAEGKKGGPKIPLGKGETTGARVHAQDKDRITWARCVIELEEEKK